MGDKPIFIIRLQVYDYLFISLLSLLSLVPCNPQSP